MGNGDVVGVGLRNCRKDIRKCRVRCYGAVEASPYLSNTNLP